MTMVMMIIMIIHCALILEISRECLESEEEDNGTQYGS